MKYIYSTSQMSKLSLTLCTFSITGSVAGLFLTLGELKHQSTTDVRVVLTHFIQSGWVKNLTTSMLVFDIAQFFPSLNHHLLLLILNKVGFNSKVSIFFRNYLVKEKQSIYGSISLPLFVMLMLVLDRVQPSLLSYLLYIFFQFFIFLKST